MKLSFTKILVAVILFLGVSTNVQAQKTGYEITVSLENFEPDTLILGNHFGDKQYIKDTVTINKSGEFVFTGEERLDCGIYLIIMPPDNNYFQVLISDEDQHVELRTDSKDAVKKMKTKGSKDNELFYEYLNFLGEQGPKAKDLNEKIAKAKEGNKDSSILEQLLKNVNKDVNEKQEKIMIENPSTLTAKIIKASRDVELPEFPNTDEGKKQRFYYAKDHWFDNLPVDDPCLLRSALLKTKVDGYLKNLTPQHPDSIIQSIDRILKLAEPNEETYRYFLGQFINQYAKSKIIGMDKVYVHLALNYYKEGKAPWTEEEQLAKIIDNAERLVPILMGEIAPNISMPLLDIDKTIEVAEHENEHMRFKFTDTITLHDVEAPYTIVYIWSPDCGHCKKAMPKMIEVYDKFHDKGVVMYAICHRTYKDTPECANFIKERPGMLKWLNLNDPYFKTKYNSKYNVKSTPQIYILNQEKEIIMKRVGADQLVEVLTDIMEKDELRKKEKN